MHVSVEATKGLERKLKIQLPAEQFDKAFDDRLKSIAKTAKLAGFRPGKVPLKVIRQKYGASVKEEILSDLVQRSYGQAIVQEKLKPAGMPHIDTRPPEPGHDVEFTAVFEVYPEIKLGDPKKLKVQKPIATIQDVDVDRMLEKLRKQRAQWEPVERAARKNDQIKIDFEGTIDGAPFEGGSAKDVALVLGAGQMIEGFEDQLIGISANEERTVKVKFPKDYGKEDLQGKKAQFKVHCSAVQAEKLPDADEDFAKSFGIEDGNLETLKGQLREHLQRELKDNIDSHVKRQLLDGLVAMHKIELPNVLVDQEIEQLQKQTLQQLGIQDGNTAGLPKDPYEEEARRRVMLGLLFAEIIKQREIKADAQRVKARIVEMATGYEQPEQVIQYYMSNKKLLGHIQALVVEDQAIEQLLEEAKVSEKNMSFDELVDANKKAG